MLVSTIPFPHKILDIPGTPDHSEYTIVEFENGDYVGKSILLPPLDSVDEHLTTTYLWSVGEAGTHKIQEAFKQHYRLMGMAAVDLYQRPGDTSYELPKDIYDPHSVLCNPAAFASADRFVLTSHGSSPSLAYTKTDLFQWKTDKFFRKLMIPHYGYVAQQNDEMHISWGGERKMYNVRSLVQLTGSFVLKRNIDAALNFLNEDIADYSPVPPTNTAS